MCPSPVLRVNTRGHDGLSSIPGRNGTLRGGATFERIADSPLDIAAWSDWLTTRGCGKVVLVGDSMGGVKAIYSQVHGRHASVLGIVGISPPRFDHERLAMPSLLVRNFAKSSRAPVIWSPADRARR